MQLKDLATQNNFQRICLFLNNKPLLPHKTGPIDSACSIIFLHDISTKPDTLIGQPE